MGEKQTDFIEINVQVTNFVTRRLVDGSKSEFSKRISNELNVDVRPVVENKALISISGKESNVKIAERLIQQLDQRAAVTQERFGISKTKAIRPEHWNQIEAELKTLLPEAQDALERSKRYIVLPSSSRKAETRDSRIFEEGAGKQFYKNAKDEMTKDKSDLPVINEFFKPVNKSQAYTYMAALDSLPGDNGKRQFANSYLYLGGPAGGGKTYTALRAGIDAYRAGMAGEIIVIRPPTTAGGTDAAMPGDQRKKSAPFTNPGIASNIQKITGQSMTQLENKGILRAIIPIWERGETYGTPEKPAFVIIDEPQNLTVQQAELLATRLGKGSIMLFSGDIGGKQTDLKNQISGLVHLIATQGSAKISNRILDKAAAFIKFTEEDSAARNPIIPHVLRAINNPPPAYAALTKAFQDAGRNPTLDRAIENIRLFAVETLNVAAEKTALHYENGGKRLFPALFGGLGANVTPFRGPGAAVG